ncbi:glycosyl hydrolase family 95 catalytic domain-containing protein [Mucilaginibacter rubeus]|nr:glycoside hydrolase family 95 protein [Mucilaginibacter rubeus]
MTEAYPMGNGRMGGMAFGGVKQERIQFNESSLWTGDENETGAYQPFGDLLIDFESAPTTVQQYRRELDLSDAVQHIGYKGEGASFSRTYFCSFPAKVTVLRFSTSQDHPSAVTLTLKDAHGSGTFAEGNMLQFGGKLENGLSYFAAAAVKADNGRLKITAGADGVRQLRIESPSSFTIILTAATDFSNLRAQRWRGEDPRVKVNRVLKAALSKSYDQLLSEHLNDYRKLFSRVSLDLGDDAARTASVTTPERVKRYRTNPDPGLEALLFQYGRYLLISASRKGGLPANLQGIWNDSKNPPWRSDYHSNINIEMNYWPAEPTNLPECDFPYLDYINSIREVKRESTLKAYPGVRGWTVKTENNIFGGSSFTWNTPGSAWYAQGIWEHYAFTKDTVYLRQFAYPILKEITQFWDDHLKRRPDGTLVSPLGWSPEHGPTEDGVTYDQAIVDDLFGNYIEAATVLRVDKLYRDSIADMRAHLLKPRIGRWGQLQEWETDRDDPQDKHRHSSNLFGLHPGRSISMLRTPELARAAKISLLARGDESTGWSMAWKINFWARLQEGEHAHKIIHNFINLAGNAGVNYDEGGGVYANLLCAHPPFQIDGNLGYTAGISEMLVQSQTGDIQLLPALPGAWRNSGTVTGLCARGGFVVKKLSWRKGKVTELVISSKVGGDCSIRVPSAIRGDGLKTGLPGTDGAFSYSFKTQAGHDYAFRASGN